MPRIAAAAFVQTHSVAILFSKNSESFDSGFTESILLLIAQPFNGWHKKGYVSSLKNQNFPKRQSCHNFYFVETLSSTVKLSKFDQFSTDASEVVSTHLQISNSHSSVLRFSSFSLERSYPRLLRNPQKTLELGFHDERRFPG